MSQITQVERMQRMIQIRDLLDEGVTEPAQIAERIGCEINTVKRNLKFLDALKIADLTSEEIASKRQEIYIELMEASTKAKEQFEKSILSEEGSLAAKRYFDAWLAALQMRAKLFGVMIDKPEQYIQINNTKNEYAPQLETPIPVGVRKQLSDALKNAHETRMLEDYA